MFTSYWFIFFLIIFLILYYVLPSDLQTPLLLCGSLLFYASAGIRYLPFILFSASSVWLFSVLINRNNKACRDYLKQNGEELSSEERKSFRKTSSARSRVLLLTALVMNLGILAAVKYALFLLDNLNVVMMRFGAEPMSFHPDMIIPLGISFYTFQAVGYLIDVYREDYEAERSFFRFLLFVIFFPQLIQGPISRYNDLSQTLYGRHAFNASSIWKGTERILWGYFKKLVIADRLLIAVNILKSDTVAYTGGYALILMIFYSLELYADFSGGIDITIGIARVLGITVKENFIRPYLSVSLADYWRRWHISMYTWFRDYVFYPLSTCRFTTDLSRLMKKSFGRSIGGKLPVYFSGLIVWLCTGIWHGPSWNFVVWGLLNFLVLSLSNEAKPLYFRFRKSFRLAETGGYRAFTVIRTFMLVCVINLFDCLIPVRTTVRLILSVFDIRLYAGFFAYGIGGLGLDMKDYILLLIACGTVLAVSVSEEKSGISIYDRIAGIGRFAPCMACSALFFVTMIFGVYGTGYDPAEFIYNRF